MPKTRIKKKTNTTGGFQDLGYTLTEDELTKIGEIDNKINKVTSTDNAIARFNGTTGAIQNSNVTITDAGKIIAPSFASDATEAGMVFSDNNELNFGSNSNTLYIGYRNKLNTSGAVGIYNFGTSSGSTGMTSGRINAGDIYSNGTKVAVESALEGLATETFVADKIAELVDSAPSELNTLKELAAGITANKTIIESVDEAVGSKAPNNHASTATTYGVATTSKYGHVKISNGDVNTVTSSNGVAAGMDHSHSNYVQTGRSINGHDLTADITLTLRDFENDAGYLTSYTETDPTVPSWAKNPTKPTYSYSEITGAPTSLSELTNDAGFITSRSLSGYVPTSRTINSKTLTTNITLTANDVGAEPAFTKNTAFNKNFGTTSGTVCQGNDSRLSNARTPTAHTHVKADITDFPTIPTVNNGTLTIQKNGTKVQTFTANQSTNVTANITVPTKTSDLTNDSGFITSADLPTGGGVTSVVGLTGDVTADQIKSGMLNSYGGFAIGENATAAYGIAIGNGASDVSSGIAIGENTTAMYGVAIGNGASSPIGGGGAIGVDAESSAGGAVGASAKTSAGGAVGMAASSTNGFAGGFNAQATVDGAVQLGNGTNSTENTLQFMSYQLLNASGNIPKERLSSTSVTSVINNKGDVTANQIKTGIQTSSGGFAIGANNPSATTGGAIGKSSNTTYGGAVGESATASTYGGAVGYYSNTTAGGAIGGYAQSTTGFAGGYDAKATADGAVQLGTGTNSTTNTLKFRSYQLLDANGKIPHQRFSQNFVRLGVKRGKGTVTLSESLENFSFILLISINDAKDLYRGPTVIPVSWIKGVDDGTSNYGKVFGIESWDGSRYRFRFNNATQGELTAEWYATDVTIYGIR